MYDKNNVIAVDTAAIWIAGLLSVWQLRILLYSLLFSVNDLAN